MQDVQLNAVEPARASTDDDDIVRQVTHLEDEFYQEGYREGFEHGKLHGVFEGRALGAEKGFEIWEEVGFIAGMAAQWASSLSHPSLNLTADKQTRIKAQIDQILHLVDRMPIQNDSSHLDKPSTFDPATDAMHLVSSEEADQAMQAVQATPESEREDIAALMTSIRSKYRLLCSSLGVRPRLRTAAAAAKLKQQRAAAASFKAPSIRPLPGYASQGTVALPKRQQSVYEIDDDAGALLEFPGSDEENHTAGLPQLSCYKVSSKMGSLNRARSTMIEDDLAQAQTPAKRPKLSEQDPNRPAQTIASQTSAISRSTQPPEKSYYCLWRKPSSKKHKTWEGDGLLIQRGAVLILRDRETGKELSVGSRPVALALSAGDELSVGSKEIEIEGPASGGQSSVVAPHTYVPSTPSMSRPLPKPRPKMPLIPTANASANKAVSELLQGGSVAPTDFFKGSSKSTSRSTFKAHSSLASRYDPKADGAVVLTRPPAELFARNKQTATLVNDVVLDPLLCKHLRPHQKEGIQFMYECVMGFKSEGTGCILADEMGLGKTVQSIGLIWTLLKQTPYATSGSVIGRALIVCPVTLVKNWSREFSKWLGRERIGVFTADAKSNIKSFTKSKTYAVLIIGYERLRTVVEDLEKCSPPIGVIICDEGHRLKSAGAKTTQALRALSAEKRVILTGTPIQNDLSELHTMVDFIIPGALDSYATFKKCFEVPILKSREPHASSEVRGLGQARSDQLASIARSFVLRRTSEVIAQFLPPKQEYVLFVRPTQLQIRLYKKILETPAVRAIFSGKGGNHLVLISALKKLCNSPGLLVKQLDQQHVKDAEDEVTESIAEELPSGLDVNDVHLSGKALALANLLESIKEKTEEKVVLVSNFTQTLNILEAFCKTRRYGYCRLDGATAQKARQGIVETFNRASQKAQFIFLLSSKSGGAGLNLIGASRLVLFDSDWNPSNDLQAMARIHRDGQKRPCHIYRLLATGTLDEKIFQRQIIKQGLAGSLMQGEGSTKTSGKQSGNSKSGTSDAFSLDELKAIFALHTETACHTHDLLGCRCRRGRSRSTTRSTEAEDSDEEQNEEVTFISAGEIRPSDQKKHLAALKDWTHIDCQDTDGGDFDDPVLSEVIAANATKSKGAITFAFTRFSTDKTMAELEGQAGCADDRILTTAKWHTTSPKRAREADDGCHVEQAAPTDDGHDYEPSKWHAQAKLDADQLPGDPEAQTQRTTSYHENITPWLRHAQDRLRFGRPDGPWGPPPPGGRPLDGPNPLDGYRMSPTTDEQVQAGVPVDAPIHTDVPERRPDAPVTNRPTVLAMRVEGPSNPEHLLLRYTPLPKRPLVTAADDPWPDRPEIASTWLSSKRPRRDPDPPVWPKEYPNMTAPLALSAQIPFSSLKKPTFESSPPLAQRHDLPRVQYDFEADIKAGSGETPARKEERLQRRDWTKRAIIHAWEGYKAAAWEHDEVRPVTGAPNDNFNGWGASLVDALDLMIMIGEDREYNLCRAHVAAIDFTMTTGAKSAYGGGDGRTIPVFETNIRYLGGLIAAYDITGDQLMLDRARELADWFMGCFNNAESLPLGRCVFGRDYHGAPGGDHGVAEMGSMSMEFARISQLTGDSTYFDVVQRIIDFVEKKIPATATGRLGSLLPTHLNAAYPQSLRGTYTWGGEADSYYEYLIKTHQLLGGATEQYARVYADAVDSAYVHLIRNVTAVPGEEFLTVGKAGWRDVELKVDHLACFAGGMLSLGARLLGRPRDHDAGRRFTKTCAFTYTGFKSGVGSESLTFYNHNDTDRFQTLTDAYTGEKYLQQKGHFVPGVRYKQGTYLGRPEVIESVFYQWRITGDPFWQDEAWRMFTAWVNVSITDHGFASVGDVNIDDPATSLRDSQESFVLAETLKYYYLIFCETDFMSLDDWVFTTEAHAFRLGTQKPTYTWAGPDDEVMRKYTNPHLNQVEQQWPRRNGWGTFLQRQARATAAKVNSARDAIARKLGNLQSAPDPDNGPVNRMGPRPVGLGGSRVL
ncbi:glycoside hydrolase family 47 protein [Mixia osmundae IAM 14324]|uniref:alpha-1,2-Mannosidase n=1 Tax=Mixia osmundae (strain CBS 9802 / IAM 14324 / JCM 22182 / KY 12970) TaxID=764103 RepID=G7DYM4_MIXOS|nr:glycoside hydrolase family 47 protein [Mixia osmundae IAM 14324]KEI41583.1 glycoside hydrolase family 47 protein [Mixia osmundae IAM 14324]GAA95684.1 hypothetical protein E5Q_02341 [Mixia osmundae IAM 14324]